MPRRDSSGRLDFNGYRCANDEGSENPRRGRLHRQAAEPPVSAAEFRQCFGKISGVEIGPQALRKMQFRIGTFPKQKIGKTLLAAGADQKVDIARPRLPRNQRGKLVACQFWQ